MDLRPDGVLWFGSSDNVSVAFPCPTCADCTGSDLPSTEPGGLTQMAIAVRNTLVVSIVICAQISSPWDLMHSIGPLATGLVELGWHNSPHFWVVIPFTEPHKGILPSTFTLV